MSDYMCMIDEEMDELAGEIATLLEYAYDDRPELMMLDFEIDLGKHSGSDVMLRLSLILWEAGQDWWEDV